MGEANIFENIIMTLTVKVSNEALYKTVEQAQFDLTLCKDKDTPLSAFAEASINVVRDGETNCFSGRATFMYDNSGDVVFPRYVKVSVNLLGIQKIDLIPLNSHKFAKSIFKNNFYNVASVVGTMGCGKTSLINSIFTAVSPSRKVLQIMLAMNTNAHVTATFDFAPLSVVSKEFRLIFVNTPGIPDDFDTESETSKTYLKNIINGTYGDGAPIGTIHDDGHVEIDIEKEVEKAAGVKKNKLGASNSVIYVIDGSREEGALRAAIVTAVDQITAMNPQNKIIVFTHKDELKLDEEEIKKMCVDSGLAERDKIFFIKNNIDSGIRNPETDFTCLELLQQVSNSKSEETQLNEIDMSASLM